MTRHGYGYVSEKGYMAFTHDLGEGAWAAISITAYDNPEHTLPANPFSVPPDIAWKLRAAWAIAVLRDALGASPEVLAGLDARWDASQRKLFHLLGAAESDQSKAIQDAAKRLKGALLSGNGTEQTTLSYDEEVDYGRNQVALMSSGPLVADVTLLGLAAMRDQISQDTEALGQGIGRGPGEKRVPSRSRRIRAAVASCAAAFNGIHGEIAWMIEHTPPGAVRTQLEAMLAPFQALLERYPAPVMTETGVEPPVEPTEPTVEPPVEAIAPSHA